MWNQLLKVAILASSVQFYWKMRAFLDWDKPFLYDHAPGPCIQILKDGGSEDLTRIDDGRVGTIIFSHGLGLEKGKLMILDASRSPFPYKELNITNPPPVSGFMKDPHGISTWKDPITGEITVFLLTHPPSEDRVEIFQLLKHDSLKHIRSITDPNFRQMNDLVAVDKDKFYITRNFYFRNAWFWYLELGLLYHLYEYGEVQFFDGKRSRTVATKLNSPNGINISPDLSTVYVSEFGAKKLSAFARKPNNYLMKMWDHGMNTGVDNIEVDPKTGDLWIGCHPVMYRILDLQHIFKFSLPSNVLKVKMLGNAVDRVIEVYADNDGDETFGASSATIVGDKLVIGTVWDQLVICDAKYIE